MRNFKLIIYKNKIINEKYLCFEDTIIIIFAFKIRRSSFFGFSDYLK